MCILQYTQKLVTFYFIKYLSFHTFLASLRMNKFVAFGLKYRLNNVYDPKIQVQYSYAVHRMYFLFSNWYFFSQVSKIRRNGMNNNIDEVYECDKAIISDALLESSTFEIVILG